MAKKGHNHTVRPAAGGDPDCFGITQCCFFDTGTKEGSPGGELLRIDRDRCQIVSEAESAL